jgi:hypothetical protein
LEKAGSPPILKRREKARMGMVNPDGGYVKFSENSSTGEIYQQPALIR